MTPMEALYRCQRAWEATQPQLFMELWPDDGLDAAETSPLGCVEPACLTPSIASPAGGLESRLKAEEAVRARPAGNPGSTGHTSSALSLVLNPGAEPCRDLLGTDGESALFTVPPATSGGSAPLINQTAPGRRSPQGTRGQGQEVPV